MRHKKQVRVQQQGKKNRGKTLKPLNKEKETGEKDGEKKTHHKKIKKQKGG